MSIFPTGKAMAVTAHACFGFLVQRQKSPVIVALTINVPIDAVIPRPNVQGSPTTGELNGFPPVSAATTFKIEYIIQPARIVTETTANLPIQAMALIPYTANIPKVIAQTPAQNAVVPKIPGIMPLPVPAWNDWPP